MFLIVTVISATVITAVVLTVLSEKASRRLLRPITEWVEDTDEDAPALDAPAERLKGPDEDAPALDATAEWFAEGDRYFADQVREEYALGDTTYGELSERFSLSKSTIGRIVRKEWRA